MSENSGSKVQWRAKFPRTKREEFLQYWGSQRRLQAADAENSRLGLVKYASCDPDQLQPYPFPSVTGSITAISLDHAPVGSNPRWKKEGYFGGEHDAPLAANEESWYATEPSMQSRYTGEHFAEGSPPNRRDTSISSIDSPPLLSISQVGLNGFNYGPATPYSEKSFAYQPDNDEVFVEQPPDPNRSRLYFNNVAQFLSYDPARLDPIREGDEYLMREAVHSEQNEQASDFDILCYMLCIIFYLANIGSDIALAIKYLTTQQYVFFGLTVFFVALPAICMTVFSAILYYQDHKIMGKKTSAISWMCRILTHMLFLAPLVRLIETLKFGLKSRQDEGWRENRKNYKYMLDEEVDLTLIRLFENFLEDAPQLTLQLYIMSAHGTGEDSILTALQYIGILTSWTSLAWSFVSFATALRNSNPGKAKMKIPSKITMFLWRFFTIGARMIALALFATAFGFWATLTLVGGHIVFAIVWMLLQNSIYCSVEIKDEEGNVKVEDHPCKEHCFRVMAGFTLVFSFFNISEGRTRLRSLFYYTIIFGENMAMILSWYITASTKTEDWYHTPAIIMVIFGFFIGIVFQILYYKCCHPIYYSKEHEEMAIPLWVPCNELSLVGPQSTKEASEAIQEGRLLSKEHRTPIYNPPSRTSSIGERVSMAGVRRSVDDAYDVNDSLLSYRPESTKRSEVPHVSRSDVRTDDEDLNTRRTPSKVYPSDRNKPRQRSPEKLKQATRQGRSLPDVSDMNSSTTRAVDSPRIGKEEQTPPRRRERSPPPQGGTPPRRRERSPPPQDGTPPHRRERFSPPQDGTPPRRRERSPPPQDGTPPRRRERSPSPKGGTPPRRRQRSPPPEEGTPPRRREKSPTSQGGTPTPSVQGAENTSSDYQEPAAHREIDQRSEPSQDASYKTTTV